ncbi:hypothetical protein AAG570_005620 [Ranatra chinensis]|uniref:Uncharacterized protein n=1 Tax=Ranatra chinensis TaxID=642074 RepID=A0ABD0Y0I7_9HEMI
MDGCGVLQGGLQDVKIVGGGHGYLGQCPQLDATCPTCGQFNTLEDTVHRLTARINKLSARLELAEGRISKVEECDCQKSCSINGSVHADGATWQHNCEICSCVHGDVECRPVQCPKIECKKPVLNPGQCCPTCLKQCYLRGTLYDHGDVVSLKQCVECECRDGSMHCTRIDPETMCPPLHCPLHLQFSVPDECCKFCPGVDYCGKGHTCHANASCLNLETTYACHCNAGFTGDGHNCVDVDECLTEGGLEGHHCRTNTRCYNTPGSYQCHCLPGHTTVDRFTCAEIDECASDLHECDPRAKCINTQGSYHCQCLEGYTGDGYHCLPVCAEVCENGGRCVDGGVCECRAGYHGSGCQLDVDECAAGLHTCNNATSTCINMPGWYYCTCAPGYTSVITVVKSQPITICQDIDECQLGNHTCHPTAQCVNTQGGYKCTCPPPTASQNNTQASCKLRGKEEIEDGGTLVRAKECEECHCTAGVATCKRSACDCTNSDPPPSPHCCPQCDPSASCSHQELAHLTFRSGEQWIYQCQTCECLLGEIDCWQVECAPIWCETQVLGTTDCCPRCADEDPCGLPSVANPSNTSIAAPAGHTAHWADTTCPNCNCKVRLVWFDFKLQLLVCLFLSYFFLQLSVHNFSFIYCIFLRRCLPFF